MDVFLTHAVLIMANVSVRQGILVQNVTAAYPVFMEKNVKMIVHWDVLQKIVVKMANATAFLDLQDVCAMNVSLDYTGIRVKIFVLQSALMNNVTDPVEIACGDANLIFLQETNVRTVCLAVMV